MPNNYKMQKQITKQYYIIVITLIYLFKIKSRYLNRYIFVLKIDLDNIVVYSRLNQSRVMQVYVIKYASMVILKMTAPSRMMSGRKETTTEQDRHDTVRRGRYASDSAATSPTHPIYRPSTVLPRPKLFVPPNLVACVRYRCTYARVFYRIIQEGASPPSVLYKRPTTRRN